MTQRKRPAPHHGNRPPSETVDSTEFTRQLGLHRHEPLTREDREDLDLIIQAAERGFRLSVQCLDCGHWVTSPQSVRRHRGPVCAAKVVAE